MSNDDRAFVLQESVGPAGGVPGDAVLLLQPYLTGKRCIRLEVPRCDSLAQSGGEPLVGRRRTGRGAWPLTRRPCPGRTSTSSASSSTSRAARTVFRTTECLHAKVGSNGSKVPGAYSPDLIRCSSSAAIMRYVPRSATLALHSCRSHSPPVSRSRKASCRHTANTRTSRTTSHHHFSSWARSWMESRSVLCQFESDRGIARTTLNRPFTFDNAKLERVRRLPVR
ncbi:hypothetical protein FHX42_003295 [Saccharopolyspora lacisalsi]|uniref:Uncharacterized protein n=1 Tax=Halosaccharopolyspora lacisalsi TaxID=1000566 RepID=A0A839DYY1_9PSEU|nr:hypothetical protein [Halosaccharopolyspora lacisalsi]